MKSFQTIVSVPTPVFRSDIDTDIIIPADYLKTTTSKGLGKHLFERVRRAEDPDFAQVEKRKGSQVLVTRDNFGCGSSREHAVWALADFGYRVVMAPSFANIFYNNALNNGLLPIPLREEDIESILADTSFNAQAQITVNLTAQVVSFEGSEYRFDIDPYKKTCFLQGMSDLDYLLSHKEKIDRYNADHAQYNFVNLTPLS